MRCSDVERLLPQYADDALPATQADGIAQHLGGCSACRGELTQLQRSLEALNQVAREPAPDLWAQFQTRVAQASAAACCREIEPLLPRFADGELERAQTLRVRDHLSECAACAAREAEYSRPLKTLEKVGRAPAAIELWPAFTARLGKSLSCQEVEKLLPALLAGESSPQILPFEYHLHACRACADSLAAYETSLSALSRVAKAAPEVDLWPAFAARLERESRRRPAASTGWLAALGTWLRGPLLQPAIGFAAFALVTVAGQLISQSVSNRLRPGDLTRLAQGGPAEIASNPHRATLAEPRDGPVAPHGRPVPEVLPAADAHAATQQTPAAPLAAVRRLTALAQPENDPGSELPQAPREKEVRVAFNLPSSRAEIEPLPESAFAPEFAAPTAVSERDGMEAVVQAVGLLAGSEDALNSPFDSKANDK